MCVLMFKLLASMPDNNVVVYAKWTQFFLDNRDACFGLQHLGKGLGWRCHICMKDVRIPLHEHLAQAYHIKRLNGDPLAPTNVPALMGICGYKNEPDVEATKPSLMRNKSVPEAAPTALTPQQAADKLAEKRAAYGKVGKVPKTVEPKTVEPPKLPKPLVGR